MQRNVFTGNKPEAMRKALAYMCQGLLEVLAEHERRGQRMFANMMSVSVCPRPMAPQSTVARQTIMAEEHLQLSLADQSSGDDAWPCADGQWPPASPMVAPRLAQIRGIGRVLLSNGQMTSLQVAGCL